MTTISRKRITRGLTALLCTAALLLSLLPASAAGGGSWAADIPALLSAGPYVEGEVVAGVDPACAGDPDLLALLGFRESLDGEDIMTVPLEGVPSGQALLTVLSRPDMTTEELLYALAGDSRVFFAEPNYIHETSQAVSAEDLIAGLRQAADRLPADSPNGGESGTDGFAAYDDITDLTPFQWGPKAIHTPSFGATGSNMAGDPIVVAVVDMPVDFSHPDLAPVAFTFTEEQQKALGCDVHGWNATWQSEDGKPAPFVNGSHGTHCAGIIGAAWDGHGISGVASNVRIISVQNVLSDGLTSLVNGLRAYDFIRRANELGAGIRIVSNSWAIAQSSRALDAAVRALGEEQGVVSVFAAGNDSRDLRDYEVSSATLARNPYIILVAASTEKEQATSFSSYGSSMVTLAAPGASILSTVQAVDGSYLADATPDSNLFYESFEDEAVRVTVVQEGADLEDAVSVTADRALSGSHALALRLDRSKLEQTGNPALRSGVLDLTIHGVTLDQRNYLGLCLNASDRAIFDACDWPCTDEDFAYLPDAMSTYGDAWMSYWMEVPEEAKQEGPFDLTVRLKFRVRENVDTIYLDSVGVGTERVPYQYYNGTSMACPMVSGAAAVLAAQSGLTGTDLAELVRTTVRQTDGLKDLVVTGGILDFEAAGNVPPARDSEPAHLLYDTDLPLDLSTGAPYDIDAQGDWETGGPLVGLGDCLYYLPSVARVEMQPGCKALLAFDLTANTWQTLPELPRWLDQVSAAAFDGKLAVKGNAMSVDPATGIPTHDDQGAVCVFVYDPAAKSWSEAAGDGVLPGQTLFALDGGLALVGGGSTGADPETGKTVSVPGVLAGYDPAAGAGETIQALTAPHNNPRAAAKDGTVYLYDADYYSLERITADGAEDLSAALPAYRAAHPDDHSVLERSERDGVLLPAGEGILLVGVLSKDGTADTWLLRDGSDKFEPLLRKACNTRPFSLAAAVHRDRVYVIGTAWNEAQLGFFRANDLSALNAAPVWERFTDVSQTAWYCDPVEWAVDNGVMNGVSDHRFAPNDPATRAMIVTMLWRMAGEPASTAEAPFTDVPAGSWYADAVSWAAELGVAKGTTETTFSPNDPVTREQLAALLYRVVQARGGGFTGAWSFPLEYTDADQISAYAYEALCWMTMNGVINGMGNGALAPKAQATRAQTAAMLQRFQTAAPLSYTAFKALDPEAQIQAFDEMTGPEIYALVKYSDENWPVTAYDLISPDNAKETIVLYDNNGDLHFNLAWPCYGGFLPESIASLKDLSGKVDVSRDGGDSGYSMSYGRNGDGSYPNDSQRSVPKSSATVRTGTLDVDQYKKAVEIVTNGQGEEARLSALTSLGYTEEIAARFLSDQAAWLGRDEVSGPNNIADGAKAAGHDVESRYGYYGITAPWQAGDLDLEGGAGQINPVFSWGTLCASGLIFDTGTAEIH